jgi:hypothetical protein
MPGGLVDNIKLWDALNRILKNNGIIDFEEINSKINQMKLQLNTLLSTVLGLEHTLDGVHNYDDASIKGQLLNLQNNMTLARNDINSLQTRTGTAESEIDVLEQKTTGFSQTENSIDIHNLGSVELSTLTANNHGTRAQLLPNQLTLSANNESGSGSDVVHGQITLGDGTAEGGVEITSDVFIRIIPRTTNSVTVAPASIIVSPDGVEIDGIRITKDMQTGITFTDLTPGYSKHVTVPWASN